MNQTYPGIERVPVVFVNAYMVDVDAADRSNGWVLIDSGLPAIGAALIERAAAARYGENVAPYGIVLTHGHFDHAGSALALARQWNVPVFAHTLELPYITGQSSYPPADPTVGGALAMMSRTFPRGPIDLGSHVMQLTPDEDQISILPGWRIVHTPGHTPGHISLFRESDGALIAGDALATMDQQSWMKTVTMPRELSCPPTPLTTDWGAAMDSVQRLAALGPNMIAAGHGIPIDGEHVPAAMRAFADRMTPPSHGRYVNEPAIADEGGVVALPPVPPDPVSLVLRAAAIGAVAGALILTAWPRRRSSSEHLRRYGRA
jgi:glyoxylase-like metal-dependent hydrolase (beta-lactamase superfamily II)